MEDALSRLANEKDAFTADETARLPIRRKVLLQSGPDIGQGNRIIFPEEFRGGFDQTECGLDLVSFRMRQQRVQSFRALRVWPERVRQRFDAAA